MKKLHAYLLEGRDLAVEDSYLKLKVGKFKSKTRVLKNTKNPVWNEEFVFGVHDLQDELVVSVYKHNDHEPGFFNVSTGNLVGRVKIPLWSIVEEENQNLPPTWFSVHRSKNVKSIDGDCGKLLLSLSMHEGDQDSSSESGVKSAWSRFSYPSTLWPKKMHDGKSVMKSITGRLDKLFVKTEETSKIDNSSEASSTSEGEDCLEETHHSSSFHELIELMKSKHGKGELPETLQGGVLLDQTYMTSADDLNIILFAPDSDFRNELSELQGTVDIHEGAWMCKPEDDFCLTRTVSYTKSATKLVKAVKATEQQKYVTAGGTEFAVSVNVSTPDVPYGTIFKVELLYRIMPGTSLSLGEESSRLEVSWAVNFGQKTMMKSVIEGGVKQGLKESFEQFASLLSRKVKLVTAADMSGEDHILATRESGLRSDMELNVKYFWNFTVVSTVFVVLYVLIHVLLCERDKLRGLEFDGLDLPDSFGEIITCGIIVIQLERVYGMIMHFVDARLRRGSDSGVRAHGDGWILTIALIEGANLTSLNSTELSDPYVVFTCNGKTRTSSVKLQTLCPQWNEILEFDLVEDPPSVLNVEVFDFDGPFDQVFSLGHAEINFLKHTSAELADLWIPLNGKLAQSAQSKLHLRIFLYNNNGVETIADYLAKMEKEVGKKLKLRSPYKNSTFQKLFGLPAEEFLINDFTCSLKRSLPLQGRLFCSARIIGFYANFLGHKTKFFFLWEDIEDIQELPPSFSTVGSPSLVIILHKGRGVDAKHGAKILDDEGRLHFYFHSFVSFNAASRTIMALWKTRTSEREQKHEILLEQQMDEHGKHLFEDTGSRFIADDLEMSLICSAELSMDNKSLVMMFDGGDLEHRVMTKSGCLNYVTTTWEPVAPEIQERQVSYKFSRHISIFGGDVASTQQKSPLENEGGWVVNEIMTLRDVPFGDHFRVHVKYQIKNSSLAHDSCKCEIYTGVVWLKGTTFQQRITKNVIGMFTQRFKEILQMMESEILLAATR
ncbi:C2 and GRAM domain-containing protein At5g50170 isoform X1 [Henckelia pumila]|uniref:C2 and GRAM domain-containing protein At5g50170 isoform X1 n=1 Tax=Henckelia pumila TaxID=405737 RepID=UPI003C6DF7D7